MRSQKIGTVAFWSLVVALLTYMTLPTIVVLMTSVNPTEILAFPPQGVSFDWYVKAVTYPDFRIAFKNGLIVTACASTLALIVGSAFAWLIHHYDFRGRGLLEGVLWSPLIIPHFTLGFGFLLLGGAFGVQQGYVMIVLAHMVLVMPFVTRAVHVSLANIDPALARAAANLGASPFQVLTRITLPLVVPGMAGGWLIAAVLSLTEFTASLYVTGSRTQTLPVAMYNYIREYADPTVSAISALLIIATTLIMLVADRTIGLRRVLAIDTH
ncbi:ABC transporter permease [Ancylobacter defluvii]|uniref:ABC transporter permease n=1 Tax=Ancylobacter defluvii TaxID=1282440 RepID=A0A9W6NBT0_9HYPH|nr:ABC transporter permease [Ancylobacter defluvii]MBS7589431.1 ABC transporter permease [Ancylobacter defluvii]GLK85048.1 ABC transporter permease [Ancylobacter defluvii]